MHFVTMTEDQWHLFKWHTANVALKHPVVIWFDVYHEFLQLQDQNKKLEIFQKLLEKSL